MVRRWYLVFQSEYDSTEGVFGPYVDRGAAKSAMDTLLAAEIAALEGLDLESVPPSAQCIPYWYHHIKLMELNPDEIEVLR